MKIESFSEGHRADLLRMRSVLYNDVDDAFHEEEMAMIESSETFECFVAVDEGGTAVGFAELSLRNIVDGCLGGPVGYIEGLYLDPEYRGQGLGGKLIDRAVEWFREKGCRQMATDSELENEAAQRYFEGRGFERKWTIVQFVKDLE